MKVLGDFSTALLPSLKLTSLGDVEKLLVRAATVLETSARAFVELRKGHAEFGAEMAVRTAGEMTPLHRAKEGREVLAYLLDINADVTARIQEMTSAYADVMVHQVALLNGMMEGVRSLLKRLGPAELERELRERGGLWPFKKSALWRLFVQRHREYTEEERQLSAAVFGNEFAKAYSAVVGEDVEQSSRILAGKPA
jgi:type VI secretion system protein